MHQIQCRTAFRAIYSAVGLTFALSSAAMAQTDGNQSAKPVWPDNGIAQRKFPGNFNMFVENDHGKWHAWVMSGLFAKAQALDFFSGEIMPVKANLLENGDQDRSFTDRRGGFHFDTNEGFDFRMRAELPNGAAPAAELLSLDGAKPLCSVKLGAVNGGDEDNSGHSKWSKVLIYHINARSDTCPSGIFLTNFSSSLDLGDGTFLLTMNCWVFRLRKSDLSPVGSAPGLRVVDASAVKAAIDQAKGKDIQDATGYLAKTLNLNFDAANSCGAEASH